MKKKLNEYYSIYDKGDQAMYGGDYTLEGAIAQAKEMYANGGAFTIEDGEGNIVYDSEPSVNYQFENNGKMTKYMKQNKRTITESQLRQIIAEAIKNSLGYPLNVHPYEVEDTNEILRKINFLLHHSGRNQKRPVLTGILRRFRDEINREVLKLPTFYDDTSSNDDEVQPWEQDELDYIHGEDEYRSNY